MSSRTPVAQAMCSLIETICRALAQIGAAKRLRMLEAKAHALEAENARLRTALAAYQRAAHLTLVQSNRVLGNRVRIDGKWHELERKLPWYQMAVDELDFVYACVRKLVGEPQFAAVPTAPRRQAKASAPNSRAGAGGLLTAA